MAPTQGHGLKERILSSLRLGRALRLMWEGSPRLTYVNLVLVVVRSALPLLVLYLTKLVVDAVAANAQGAGGEFSHILWLLGITAAAGLTASLVGVVAGLVTEAHSYRVTDKVLESIHRKSVRLDLRYYEDPQYHDILHRAQRDAPSRPSAVLGNLLRLAQSGLTVLGIVGLLATIHWFLAIALFLGVTPALVVRVRYANRYYQWQKRSAGMQRHTSYLSYLLLYTPPAKEIRLFGLGEVLADRFRDLQAHLRRETIEMSTARGKGEAIAQSIASLAIFGAFAYIAWRSFEGALTIGDLVMYFGAVQRGQSAAQGFFASLGSLYEDNLFLATLDEFTALEPTIVAPAQAAIVPTPMREGIAFRGVTFRYPGSSRPLLEDVELTIGPDEVVALVGANGAGKTTIVKLLCRLYDPDAGSITIDGVDLREFDPIALRRRISVVFQDFVHFFLPARDNIWFGDVTRPRDETAIREAATIAGADSFLRELRHGYDTHLGTYFQGGEELSIGEWQKVATARAFFREAQLLVVDEPTSSLDAIAEAELFEKLRDLLRGRSTLLISHRFSTVRMADRIYVIEDGKVLESGSHDELMRHGGKYASLFRLQAAPYQGEDTSHPAPASLREP